VFVGGIPWNCDEATLKKDFEECGEMTNFHMPMADGRPKGIAFITYSTTEGVTKALKFNGADYGGRPLQVRLSSVKSTKGAGKGAASNRNDELTAFMTGLPWSVNQDSMRKQFGECGTIERLVLPSDESGQAKGVAFVQFSDKAGLDKALALDGSNFGGRQITVRVYDGPGKGSKGAGGKGKDGKDGTDGKESKRESYGKSDGKSKGKDKGKKGKAEENTGNAEWTKNPKHTGGIVESTGTKRTFDDSDEE